jgi:Rhodopirellula transposase DDE domain
MRELTITADCGGSNGARLRLWKVELQKLADETNLTIKVRHYPPGTSKWNKIEHRLFCRITQNWRGRPLTDHATIIELIAATKTKTGLKVESALDTRAYEKGMRSAMNCLASIFDGSPASMPPGVALTTRSKPDGFGVPVATT